jgi:hypothetical protein
VARRSRFQATTGPKAASSGQKGSPKGHPERTVCGSTSGWKLYGSVHGASRRSSWWPTSQKRYTAWRWSPAAVSPSPSPPSAMNALPKERIVGSVAASAATT